MRICIKIILPFFVILKSAFAYNPVGGTVSRGAGNTGVAAVEAGDASFLNPAIVPHLREVFFNTYLVEDHLADDGKTYKTSALSLIDNSSMTTVPTALSYRSSKHLKETRLGVAQFIAPYLTMGVGLDYQVARVSSTTSYHQTGLDFGIVYTPTDKLGIGVIYYNLANWSSHIPDDYLLKPAQSIGLNYIFDKVIRVRAELLNSEGEDKIVSKIGLESFLGAFFVLRLGSINDDNESASHINRYTGGIGFIGPQFQINYSYQVDKKEAHEFEHSIDFNLPFW